MPGVSSVFDSSAGGGNKDRAPVPARRPPAGGAGAAATATAPLLKRRGTSEVRTGAPVDGQLAAVAIVW